MTDEEIRKLRVDIEALLYFKMHGSKRVNIYSENIKFIEEILEKELDLINDHFIDLTKITSEDIKNLKDCGDCLLLAGVKL